MRLCGFCEEDGSLDVGVEVTSVELLGCVYQVGLVSLSSAKIRVSSYYFALS